MIKEAVAVILALLVSAHQSPAVPKASESTSEEAAPELIPSLVKGHPIPLWVAATAASDSNGHLRSDRFEAYQRESLEAVVTRNQQSRLAQGHTPGPASPSAPPEAGVDCQELFGGPVEGRVEAKANNSLEDLTKNAVAVYRGHIQRIIPGFSEGVPQSLLQIKVDETLRQPPGERRFAVLFVLHPWARFWIADQPFCTGVAPTHEPREGDRVLFFRYDPSLSPALGVFAPELEEVVFERATGGLTLPRGLQHDDEVGPVANLEELATITRRALRSLP
jgi:hypothetical protein